MTIILAVWGVASNFRDDFLTPENQAKWVMRLLLPRWYWMVIAFLVMTVIAILEGAYRTHRSKVNDLNTAHELEIGKLKEAHKLETEGQNNYLKEINEDRHSITVARQRLVDKSISLEKELHSVEQERNALKSQLEERDKYKLKIEVDTETHIIKSWETERSCVFGVAQPFDDKSAQTTEYSIKPQFRIRFVNEGSHNAMMKRLTILLLRDTEQGEEDVPLRRATISGHKVTGIGGLKLRDKIFPAKEWSDYYWLNGHFELKPEHRELLDQNCFLRIRMEAKDQKILDLDFSVDWEKAFKDGAGESPVVPRT